MRRIALVVSVLSVLVVSGLAAVELTVLERSGIDRRQEPVTTGVPLPRGWAVSTEGLALSSSGRPLPAEFRAAALWPDGSIRWLHMDFKLDMPKNGHRYLSIDKGAPQSYDSPLRVERTQGRIIVTTGRLRAEVAEAGFNIIDRLHVGEGYASELVAPHERGLLMWAGGVEYSSFNDKSSVVEIEHSGPMRLVLRAEGDLVSASGEKAFRYICRLYFFSESPLVRLAFTFENRGPYLESREDKVSLQGLHAELPVSGAPGRFFLGMPDQVSAGEFSGGDGVASISAPKSTELRFAAGGVERNIGNPKALKSDRIGWAALQAGDFVAGVGVRDFWQMHPSRVEVRQADGMLVAGLVPHDGTNSIDIYSGVARTHYLNFAFLPGEDSAWLEGALAAVQRPLLAVADPAWNCRDTRAFSGLTERNPALYPPENRAEAARVESELDKGLLSMLEKVDSRNKNGVTAEGYGLLGWGDAMHYAWQPGVNDPRNIAWNGHYYDLPHMCCLEFIRTGDYRWLDFFLSRAYHLMDVHLTHFEPGHRLNGASRYCPPTDHVRVDPSNTSDFLTAGVYISPYANHHKTEGLFDRYYLTGDERSIEVALKGLEFANAFGSYTDFKQPRGAAFQVLTLIAGYRHTGDIKYLNTAKGTFQVWWDHFAGTNDKFTQGTFMVGFLLEAFINLHETSPDSRIPNFVKQAVDWMRAKESVRYSNMAFGIGWLAETLPDSAYRAVQKQYLAGWVGEWSNAFKDFGLNGRSIPRSLYWLSYEGLGQESPGPVEPLRGDYDGNGALDLLDVLFLMLALRDNPTDPAFDYNRDGEFTVADAVDLLKRIAQGGSGAALSVSGTSGGSKFSFSDRQYLIEAVSGLEISGSRRDALLAVLGAANLPRAFSLEQNRPNPFNPSTMISITLPEAAMVTLQVFDLRGRQVRELAGYRMEAGQHAVHWDGSSEDGVALASGVYFYRLRAGSHSAVRKMVVLR